MIRLTTWRPDTCDCEVVYSWDDALPAEERIHTAHAVNKACEAHVGGVEDIHASVLEENQRKNKTLAAIASSFPNELRKPILDEKGNIVDYAFLKMPDWSIDKVTRAVSVDLSEHNLSDEQLAVVQSALSEQIVSVPTKIITEASDVAVDVLK